MENTACYYREQAMKIRDETDCTEYMKKVIRSLDQENLRSCKYLHPSSYAKVNEEFQNQMVVQHIDFINEYCKEAVAKERLEDLQYMYRLLHPMKNGLDVLVSNLQEHISQITKGTVSDMKVDGALPTRYVETVIALHTKYVTMIKERFADEPIFKKAFISGVNAKVGKDCRSAELLVRYCDGLLKKGKENVAES